MRTGGAYRGGRRRGCRLLGPLAGLGLAAGGLLATTALAGPAESGAPSKSQAAAEQPIHPGQPGGAPCAPVVQVDGDPALGAAVRAALQARGVESQPIEGCPVTRVSLQAADHHIAVLLRDEVRRAQRLVADRDTAVALIESWVRSDLSAPLLLSTLLPPPVAAAPPTPPIPSPPSSAGPRVSAAVYFDLGGDVAGSTWAGANLRGCGRVFRLCIGGGWRTLTQISHESRDGRRIATEFLAILGLPLSLGRVELWPSLGLGVSWLHTAARIATDDSSSGSNPSLEASDGGSGQNSVAVSADQGHMQAELRLELSIPIASGLSLSVATALDATLSRVTPPLVSVPVVKDGVSTSQIIQLATPPWGVVLGQLGLRWSPR